MMQIVMNAGKESEQVMDLVDTHDMVLVQFCNMMIRHRDLRESDVRDSIQDIIEALKVKLEKGSNEYNSYDVKSFITQAAAVLKQVSENA